MVHAFLDAHSALVRDMTVVLGFIATIFGGRGLQKLPWLAQQGGVLSRLLVAIPAAAVVTASYYFLDEQLKFLYTDTFSAVLAISLSPLWVALFMGLLLG